MYFFITVIWIVIAAIFLVLTFVSFRFNNALNQETRVHGLSADGGTFVHLPLVEKAIDELKNTIKHMSLIGAIGFILSFFAAILSIFSQ